MSGTRARRGDEQYEKWYMRDCVRCGRHARFAAHWPDGYVCRTCHNKAFKHRGRCPDCGYLRALAGRDADGMAICTACAGFSGYSYACRRCRREDIMYRDKLCARCTLSDRLTELLGDQSGTVRPALRPLLDSLAGRDDAAQALLWVGRSYVADLLRALGSGELALTHEAFNDADPKATAEHLRELCVHLELLPARDHQLVLFERWWTREFRPALTDPATARTIEMFVAWEVAARLRRRAGEGSLTPHARSWAVDQVRRAAEFLGWLQCRGRALSSCSQADLDRWHADHPAHRRTRLRAFLAWAIKTKQMRSLELPTTELRRRAPITSRERHDLLDRLLDPHELPLRPRVVALLVLLFGQPLTRIARLRHDDVHVSAEKEVTLALGTQPAPVPPAAAAVLLEFCEHRAHASNASNPDAPWVFPGRSAGQPTHPAILGQELTRHGLPGTRGRTAALRDLAQHAPAPVIAEALGIHPVTAHRHRTGAGATWSAYPSLAREPR